MRACDIPPRCRSNPAKRGVKWDAGRPQDRPLTVATSNGRLFHPLPSDFACSADRRRNRPLEIISCESDDRSLLFGPGPVWVGAALDLETDDFRRWIKRIRAVVPDASFHGGLVFCRRSLCTVAGCKFGNVGIDIDDRVTTISLENDDAGSLWTK